jgi:DNA replication initiation complex subunit (GINS family)
MKKNFTVNISGILFNIDEDAYARLQQYIDRLNKHFQNSQEGSEIISDIESRIAEMMQDKLSAL